MTIYKIEYYSPLTDSLQSILFDNNASAYQWWHTFERTINDLESFAVMYKLDSDGDGRFEGHVVDYTHY